MSGAEGLDIDPSDLALVLAILVRHVPGREIWAFGSRVGGRARKYSDLDLCVVGDAPLPADIRAALAEDFSESDLPYKVDLVDWAAASGSFRDIISSGKIVLLAG
jgi:uncharacterized protein